MISRLSARTSVVPDASVIEFEMWALVTGFAIRTTTDAPTPAAPPTATAPEMMPTGSSPIRSSLSAMTRRSPVVWIVELVTCASVVLPTLMIGTLPATPAVPAPAPVIVIDFDVSSLKAVTSTPPSRARTFAPFVT